MVSQPQTKPTYTPAEYLALERAAERKSEFLNGQIYAMSGASMPHNIITHNISRHLGNQFAGRPCQAVSSDLRVKVEASGMYTYPDVVAVCGEQRFEDKEVDTLLNPTVLFEVLSPSTEAYDRGKKFEYYQQIEALQEYLLVAQDRVRIEHYVRQGDNWVLSVARDPAGTIHLPSIGCTIGMAAIYENVEIPG